MSRPVELRVSYAQTVAILPGLWRKIGVVAGFALIVVAPLVVSARWQLVLVEAAIAVIGAIGLNLLTGYTGQVSLGQGAFLGIGAYTAAYFAADRGWPFLVAMVLGGLVSMAVGAMIGPVAFRLKGLYLSIVTLGLVFLADHVFDNWDSVTGGVQGRQGPPADILGFPLSPKPSEREIFGIMIDRPTRWFWFAAIVATLCALFAKNLARSRTGRAFQAVRDRDVAAAIIGVDVRRAKLTAFMVSSFYAGLAGAMLGSWVRFISPEVAFGLEVSIRYIAMIIIGGIGTIWGAVAGAIFVTAIPRFVDSAARALPFAGEQGEIGPFTSSELSAMLYGVVVVLFLLLEPLGLYGIWLRIKAYFLAWPFRY